MGHPGRKDGERGKVMAVQGGKGRRELMWKRREEFVNRREIKREETKKGQRVKRKGER